MIELTSCMFCAATCVFAAGNHKLKQMCAMKADVLLHAVVSL